MAWPYSNVVAPNLDSGIVAIGTGSVVIFSGGIWLLGLWLVNTTSQQQTIRVTDGSDVTIIPDIAIPAKSFLAVEVPFLPLTGLKWLSSVASGVQGKAWGYQ